MKRHKILRGDPQNFTYNLMFNKDSMVDTYLPAPSIFNVHNRGRYYVLESEARAHNAAVVVARQGEASTPRAPVSYHSNHYTGYWLITKLGQKPKLGGVRVSHRYYIHVHLFLFVGVYTFSLFHPCLILFSCFLLVCLKKLRKTKKLVVVSLLSMHA